jgi:hypothetical protein
MNGSSAWTRTRDPAVNSRLLYQLSYAGMFGERKTSRAARGVKRDDRRPAFARMGDAEARRCFAVLML